MKHFSNFIIFQFLFYSTLLLFIFVCRSHSRCTPPGWTRRCLSIRKGDDARIVLKIAKKQQECGPGEPRRRRKWRGWSGLPGCETPDTPTVHRTPRLRQSVLARTPPRARLFFHFFSFFIIIFFFPFLDGADRTLYLIRRVFLLLFSPRGARLLGLLFEVRNASSCASTRPLRAAAKPYEDDADDFGGAQELPRPGSALTRAPGSYTRMMYAPCSSSSNIKGTHCVPPLYILPCLLPLGRCS